MDPVSDGSFKMISIGSFAAYCENFITAMHSFKIPQLCSHTASNR